MTIDGLIPQADTATAQSVVVDADPATTRAAIATTDPMATRVARTLNAVSMAPERAAARLRGEVIRAIRAEAEAAARPPRPVPAGA